MFSSLIIQTLSITTFHNILPCVQFCWQTIKGMCTMMHQQFTKIPRISMMGWVQPFLNPRSLAQNTIKGMSSHTADLIIYGNLLHDGIGESRLIKLPGKLNTIFGSASHKSPLCTYYYSMHMRIYTQTSMRLSIMVSCTEINYTCQQPASQPRICTRVPTEISQ